MLINIDMPRHGCAILLDDVKIYFEGKYGLCSVAHSIFVVSGFYWMN